MHEYIEAGALRRAEFFAQHLAKPVEHRVAVAHRIAVAHAYAHAIVKLEHNSGPGESHGGDWCGQRRHRGH
jgi:hypothetical protein